MLFSAVRWPVRARSLAVVRPFAVLASLAVAAVGCGGSSSTAPSPKTYATLIVTRVAPAGTASTITVAGPSNYALDIGGTDTLRALAAGTYRVIAGPGTQSDPVVNLILTTAVAGSPTTIGLGDTGRITVTYTRTGGTGALYVTGSSSGASVAAAYTSTELQGRSAAGTTFPVAGQAIAVDTSGNLWVASAGANSITEYPSMELSVGTPAAGVTITGSGLSGPSGIAFDRLGDLWVSNATGNTVVEYTAAQLAAGGAPVPTITLGGAALSAPAAITFDLYGNLWVASAGANTVIQYSPAQLAAGGSPTPAVTLSAAGGSLAAPQGLAFDSHGDLWVTNASANTVVEFTNGQLVASASPAPAETITLPAVGAAPGALAFDNSGDLWVLGRAQGQLIEFTAAQLIAGGSPAPGATLPAPTNPGGLAFSPSPAGLPLVGWGQARVQPRVRRPTI